MRKYAYHFFDLFDEDNYDVIQTGRSGHPEYPFIHINKTPIIDSIHLAGMGEDKGNVYRTVLISQEQKSKWVQAGGNPQRGVIIPVPVEVPDYDSSSYIEELDGKVNLFLECIKEMICIFSHLCH